MLLLFKAKLSMLNKNCTTVVFLNNIYRQFKTIRIYNDAFYMSYRFRTYATIFVRRLKRFGRIYKLANN